MLAHLTAIGLAGFMLALASGSSMTGLGDSSAMVQLQALPELPEQLKQMFSQESLVKMATDYGRNAIKKAVVQKTPLGLGRLIVNEKDKVTQCSDISTSLLCGMSAKIYGLTCTGWGGHRCLERSASCADIKLPGICNNAKARVNISCLGWGGESCLEHGADASMILDEHICAKSEGMLGISSLGWGGSECLTKETAACEKLTLPGICNDAALRLGLECLGWGGATCLSRGSAQCSHITTRHICQQSMPRFSLNCTWHTQACVDA